MDSKRKDSLFWGGLLIIYGVFAILNALEINYDPYIKGWWAAILIVIGVYKVIKGSNLFTGLFLVGAGSVFLLAERGLINDKLPFPIIIVLLGILIFFNPNRLIDSSGKEKKNKTSKRIEDKEE